ncbi:MAG: hypothetical protein WCI18_16950 [Pseudomonadota bacterium]
MKKLLANTIQIRLWAAVPILGMATLAVAKPEGSGTPKKIAADEICRRLEIFEEILVFDKEGALTNFRTQVRGSSGSIQSKKGNQEPNRLDEECKTTSMSGQGATGFEVFLSHEWTVKKDGAIFVKYNQGTAFNGRGKESKLLNPMGEVSSEIKNFQAVSWQSPFHKDQTIIMRLTPRLKDENSTVDISKFPIVLDNSVVFDGKGRLWAASLEAKGEYICFSSAQGTVSLSFHDFAGASKTALVEGSTIKFKGSDNLSIVIKSESLILPAGISANAFVKVNLGRKSEGINSSQVNAGDQPSTFDRCVN